MILDIDPSFKLDKRYHISHRIEESDLPVTHFLQKAVETNPESFTSKISSRVGDLGIFASSRRAKIDRPQVTAMSKDWFCRISIQPKPNRVGDQRSLETVKRLLVRMRWSVRRAAETFRVKTYRISGTWDVKVLQLDSPLVISNKNSGRHVSDFAEHLYNLHISLMRVGMNQGDRTCSVSTLRGIQNDHFGRIPVLSCNDLSISKVFVYQLLKLFLAPEQVIWLCVCTHLYTRYLE